MRIIFAFILLLSIFSFNCFAQDSAINKQYVKRPPADTIYYLADSTKTAPKDRIATLKTSWIFKHLLIRCSCMDTDWKGIFLSAATQYGIPIDRRKFKSLKLTTLADLIAIAKENNTLYFGFKYVVYIIEPVKSGKYKMYKVVNRSTEDMVQTVY